MRKKIKGFEVWVFVAYGFYMLLGLAWFVLSIVNSGRFNASAFAVLVIFACQAWFRHRVTNLIIGILALLFSIFMLLDVVNLMLQASGPAPFKAYVALSLVSVVLSVVLVFSYIKLSFRDQ